jgi:indole-3-glycerol phosphate synthase
LEAIVESAKERAAGLDLAALVSAAEAAPQPRSFAAALSAPGLSVIAEIKRKSPSAGDIAPDLDAAARAAAYAAGGAAAISVLTEPHFFAGSLDDLAAVRRGVLLPVLRKDFIVAPAQVWESRAAAADAVLLIVAALDDGQLFDLLAVAADAGIDALVEVHDEAECERAIAAGAGIVGVNNRDLRTFLTDPAVAERMAPHLASVPVTVAESGVGSGAVARRMEAAGYDAILVGEALVRAGDPARLVAELAGEGATAP